jgi:cytochrome c oxidase assembly protein subunit 15
MGAAAWRSRYLPRASRALMAGVALAVTAQALLGVATLMSRAPIGLGVAHQLAAALTLSLAVATAWRIRRV